MEDTHLVNEGVRLICHSQNFYFKFEYMFLKHIFLYITVEQLNCIWQILGNYSTIQLELNVKNQY